MIKWFKKLLHIVKHFDDYANTLEQLSQQQYHFKHDLNDAVAMIKSRTEVHADIHMRSTGDMNQIVMIGKYHGNDYVETFNVPPDDFELLILKLRDLRKYARLGRVDVVPGMKQIIETESSDWRY